MSLKLKTLLPIVVGALLISSGAARGATSKQLAPSDPSHVKPSGSAPALLLAQGDLVVVMPRAGNLCQPLALVKVVDLSRAGAPWSMITTAAVLERTVTSGRPTCTGVVTPDQLAGVLRPRANVVAWAEAGPGVHGRTESLALRNICDDAACRLSLAEAVAAPKSDTVEPCPDSKPGTIGEAIETVR